MSAKRGSKQHVPSVMARLMGFEEIQPPQHVQKKARVFSEDYLYRVASIGAREKCSDSIWLRAEETYECRNIFQVLETLRRNKHHNLPIRKKEFHFKAMAELKAATPVLGDDKVQTEASTVNHSKIHNKGYVRKMVNLDNKPREPSNLHPKVVLSSSCAYEFRDGKFRTGNERGNVGQSKRGCIPTTDAVLLKPKPREENGAVGHLEEKKTLQSGLRPVRRSRFLRETSRKKVHVISSLPINESMSEHSGNGFIAKDSESSTPSSPVSSCKKNQFYSDGSYATMEAKKQISEKWKTARRFQQAGLVNMSNPDKHIMNGLRKQVIRENANVKLCVPSGIDTVRESIKCRSLLPFFNAVASPYTRTRHASPENGQHKLEEQDFYQDLESYNNEGREEDMFDQDFVVPKSSIRRAFSISMKRVEENEVVQMFPSNHELQLEVENCISLGHQKDSSSHLNDSSIQQDMSNEIFEEDSVASQFSGSPESPISFEEGYQQSPNSVLESLYKKEMPSTACFKGADTYLNGLHMQLELLKSETVDSYSEGSSIIVSSDDDAGEESVIDTEENEDPLHSFKVEESRDFSYLVDILSESGFKNKSLLCLESPINYSVFETLEKKYGEQVSWKRSERRLLFDSINFGLMELVRTSIDVLTGTKAVARRCSLSYDHKEAIDDKIWMLLLSQEKEASKESEKFLGKDDGWMELGEDIEDISREIENFLIEELVADACMEMFN